MSSTLYTGVQVLDGSGEKPFFGEVLIQGNRIKQIARDGARIEHKDADVIDGGGATLMPGLVEGHAHPSFINSASLEAIGDVPPEEAAASTPPAKNTWSRISVTTTRSTDAPIESTTSRMRSSGTPSATRAP